MTDDEPRIEPSDDQPVSEGARPPTSPTADSATPKDADDGVDAPDKTDMSAVGDDGQVFGG